ncbi:hypothetical protein [Aeromicrobium sp.]|uniref:hypothetical protein n=1 Tax=Aeromicrobium sp. TaxID=1871063 RepID=UPI003C575902
MTDAGYSATPQLQKLGIVPGVRLRMVGADPGWSFAERLDDIEVVNEGPCNIALIFVRTLAELDNVLRWGELVYPSGACWVAWPRKASGHVSEVDENAIRDAALAVGMVDVKVAAIDDDWSGLKIVWRKENRTGRISKTAIQDALRNDAS